MKHLIINIKNTFVSMPCSICGDYVHHSMKICKLCIETAMVYKTEAIGSYYLTVEELTPLFCLEVKNPHNPGKKSHKYMIKDLEILQAKLLADLTIDDKRKAKMLEKKKYRDNEKSKEQQIENNVGNKKQEIKKCLDTYLVKLDAIYVKYFDSLISRSIDDSTRSTENSNQIAIKIYCEIEKNIGAKKKLDERTKQLDILLEAKFNKTQCKMLKSSDEYKTFVKSGDIKNITVTFGHCDNIIQKDHEKRVRDKLLKVELKKIGLDIAKNKNHYQYFFSHCSKQYGDYVYHNNNTIENTIAKIRLCCKFAKILNKYNEKDVTKNKYMFYYIKEKFVGGTINEGIAQTEIEKLGCKIKL